jgi:hypothetical protein
MGNCWSSTATAPSSPSPRVTETTTPALELTTVVPRTAPTRSNPSSSRSHVPTRARVQGNKSRVTAPRCNISIQASIKYVVCLLRGFPISFICSFSELDKAVSTSISRTRRFGTLIIPLGHWCRLWSRLDFADQPLKNCVNTLHVNIVKIWEQNDGNNVSSPQLPSCFICSTESVFVKQPIQDKYVSRRQRSSLVN